MPHLILAPLVERTVPQTAFWSFLRLAGSGYPFFMQPATRTDVARNRYAEALLRSSFTHVLMLDVDHDHPADLPQRLLMRVEEDPAREIMGALCFRRTAPFDPLAVRAVPKGPWAPVSGRDEGLLACDVVGTGANLIARTVFERLPRPWFHYGYEGASRDTWPGEDTSFCRKARAAGIQVWVDTSVVSPHLGEVAVDRETGLGRGAERGHPAGVGGTPAELDLLRSQVPWLFRCRRVLVAGTATRHGEVLRSMGAVVSVWGEGGHPGTRWEAALWCLDPGLSAGDPTRTLSELESLAHQVVVLAPLSGPVSEADLEERGYEGVLVGAVGDPGSRLRRSWALWCSALVVRAPGWRWGWP